MTKKTLVELAKTEQSMLEAALLETITAFTSRLFEILPFQKGPIGEIPYAFNFSWHDEPGLMIGQEQGQQDEAYLAALVRASARGFLREFTLQILGSDYFLGTPNVSEFSLETMDDVAGIDCDDPADFILLHAKTLRRWRELVREIPVISFPSKGKSVSRKAMLDFVVELPSGKMCPAWCGIPVIRNDFQPEDTIIAGKVQSDENPHGLLGHIEFLNLESTKNLENMMVHWGLSAYGYSYSIRKVTFSS